MTPATSRRFVVLSLMTLALGCDDLSGTLQVRNPITFKDEKGKTFSLPQGGHATDFDYDHNGGKDSELEIKVKDTSGKKRKVILKVPAGINVPTYRGTFLLTGAQTGQAFDLRGEVQTDVQDSGPQYGSESCSWTRRVERCYRDSRGHRRCDWVRETTWGRRDYTYRVETTTVRGYSEFTDVNLGVLARFDGANTQNRTVRESEGLCR
jgi:hypothetical protein